MVPTNRSLSLANWDAKLYVCVTVPCGDCKELYLMIIVMQRVIIILDRGQSEMTLFAKTIGVTCSEGPCVLPHSHSKPRCTLEDEVED